MLKLALSATSKLVCMCLADMNDVLDLGNQIVVFVDRLQVSQKVLGRVTEESDAVSSLTVALSDFKDVVVGLSLLVHLDELVDML